MHTHLNVQTETLILTPPPPALSRPASLPGRGNESWAIRRGWLQEIKTCLISAATNGDAALHTLCPLIGLCHSLHLEAHVILSNPPP